MALPFQRRTLVVILLVTIVALLGLLFWLLRSLFFASKAPVQPPVLPSTVPVSQAEPSSAPAQPPERRPETGPDKTLTPAEQERQAQEALVRFAMSVTSRLGSYSNADDFASIKDAYDLVTPGVQTYLETVWATLTKDHPISGGSWGQTTEALAPRLVSGMPILSAQTAEVLVQTRQIIQQNRQSSRGYQDALLTLTKTGGIWLVSRLTWTPTAQ
ncbi:MAG: hypothetical protein WCV84_00470 [Patescibacteria group bacterium]